MANTGNLFPVPTNAELAGTGFATATDSLKVLSDNVDLVEGAGFNTATDSLKILSDEIALVPKTTDVVSKCSGTIAGVIKEIANAGTPGIVTVATGGVANTFSAWQAMGAGVAAVSWLCGLNIYCDDIVAGIFRVVIEVGKGAPGAEVSLVRFSFTNGGGTTAGRYGMNAFTIPIPIKLALGDVISFRVATNWAVGRTWYVGIQHYELLEV